jgi:uncharacterized OB-fold protein
MESGHPDLAGYREGLLAGEIRAQHCDGCQRTWWPPRPACPRCQCTRYTWVRLPECGELYTWTVVGHTRLAEFQPLVPYAVGLVAIPEAGIRVIGRISGSPDGLEFGMALRWTVLECGAGGPQPVWEPEAG